MLNPTLQAVHRRSGMQPSLSFQASHPHLGLPLSHSSILTPGSPLVDSIPSCNHFSHNSNMCYVRPAKFTICGHVREGVLRRCDKAASTTAPTPRPIPIPRAGRVEEEAVIDTQFRPRSDPEYAAALQKHGATNNVSSSSNSSNSNNNNTSRLAGYLDLVSNNPKPSRTREPPNTMKALPPVSRNGGREFDATVAAYRGAAAAADGGRGGCNGDGDDEDVAYPNEEYFRGRPRRLDQMPQNTGNRGIVGLPGIGTGTMVSGPNRAIGYAGDAVLGSPGSGNGVNSYTSNTSPGDGGKGMEVMLLQKPGPAARYQRKRPGILDAARSNAMPYTPYSNENVSALVNYSRGREHNDNSHGENRNRNAIAERQYIQPLPTVRNNNYNNYSSSSSSGNNLSPISPSFATLTRFPTSPTTIATGVESTTPTYPRRMSTSLSENGSGVAIIYSPQFQRLVCEKVDVRMMKLETQEGLCGACLMLGTVGIKGDGERRRSNEGEGRGKWEKVKGWLGMS